MVLFFRTQQQGFGHGQPQTQMQSNTGNQGQGVYYLTIELLLHKSNFVLIFIKFDISVF